MNLFYKSMLGAASISLLFVAQNAVSIELEAPASVSEQEWNTVGLDERLTASQAGSVSNGMAEAQSPVFGDTAPVIAPMAMSMATQSATTPTVGLSSGIAELAAALDGDVVKMNKWIHDNIDYVPYYGLMQGAEQTFLSRSGNDADQAALLVEMAKAAGHQTAYMVGQIWVPKANAPNWIGAVDLDETWDAFLNGGYAYPQQIALTTDSLTMIHIFPMVDTGNGWFFYFPAVKGYYHTSQSDVEALVGYNRASLLSAVGGTTDAYSAVGLDYNAMSSHLTGLTTGLVSSLRENYPNASEDILMGHRTINPDDSFGFSYGQIQAYYDLPDAYRHKVYVNAGGTEITYDQADRGVDKVYFKYSNGIFSRHFDGYASESFSEPGLTQIEIISDKPYAANNGGFADSTNMYPIANGGIYVLTQGYAGSSSGAGADYYSKRLNMMLADDSFDAEAKVSESLAFAGEVFMQETAAVQKILDGSQGNRRIVHCRTGLIGQEAGYYIDIKNQLASSYAGFADSGDSGIKPYMMLFSGLEHAVLEQTQSPEKEAVSTVRILKLANESSNPVYRLDSSNFSAASAQLSGYSSAQLNGFQSTVNGGGSVILPKNADVVLNDWTGEGYIEHYFSGSIEGVFMAIGGGYNGGFGSNEGQYDYWQLYTNERARELPNVQTQTFTAADPVDMTTGAYLFDHTDLSMNGPLPLTLSRHYSSHSSLLDGPMGYGWTHSYNIRAQEHSGYEAGLGLRSPEDAAAIFVAATVIRDLVENENSAKGWLTASLAVNWAMEQLTENAVSIYVGQKVMTFIEQPDGSYTAPPGMTASLTKEGGLYVMRERHGNRYEFDANLNLAEIEDQHGNTLTFGYNAQTNLQSVTSSFGPAFTFGYTGDLLTSVTDNSSPTRSISYQYDSDNNLTNFVDAAGYSWGVGYDNSHRVKWMKDPEQVTTIQNFYNGIGQITNQISSSGNPWDFHFTGSYNISEDPLGNATTYYLDHKDRTWSVEQPNGARSYSVFDGQNHVVQSIAPNGVTNAIVYDVHHNVLSQTNAVGLPEQIVTTYGYDSEHHLRFVTNAVGTTEQTVTETTYTAEHKVDTVTVAKGTALETVTDYNYNSDGLVDQVSEGNGARVTTYNYDSNSQYGNPKTTSSTDAGTVTTIYDKQGNLKSQTVDGKTTEFDYDDRRLLVTTTYAKGSADEFSTSRTYWKNRLLKTSTDGRGETTRTYWTDAYKQAGSVFADGSNVTNSYDAADRLIATRNPEGYWTTNVLDEVGRVLVVQTSESTVSNSYDIVGNLLEFTDAEERTTQYDYDALNRKIRIDLPDGTATTFGYDSVGRLTSTTNQPGTALERVTSQNFDTKGQLTGITDAMGNSSSYEYNALGFRIRETDPLSNSTYTGFNAQGQPTSVTNALGQVTDMTYDLSGNLKTVTDPLGRTTEYTYDGLNRRTRADYPDGTFTTTGFDANGNVLSRTDARNNTKTFGYNEMNRLVASTSTVDSVSAVTRYTYNDNGSVLTETDAENNVVTHTYDALNRRVSSTSTYSSLTNEFDRVGNLVKATSDPGGLNLWTSMAHDALNRVVSQETAISIQSFDIDALGRVTNTVDALYKNWETEYDALDRPVAAIRPSGAREETRFDALGRRTRFLNAEGKPISFGLDALGRVTSITNAIGKVTSFTFDDAGNLGTRTSADSSLTQYGYDSRNRLSAVTNQGAEVATYSYDSNGNLSTQANAATSESFGYNEINLLSASTQTVNGVTAVVQNAYDRNGNRTQIVYPGGLTVDYTFGADNRLDTVTFDGSMLAASKSVQFGYDTANRLTSIDYPNSVDSTFGYDAEGRITSIEHGSFIDRTIQRNALGFKHTELIDAGLKPTAPETARRFKNHNDADQLVSEQVQSSVTNWTDVTYSYSLNGCLTNIQADAQSTDSYAYDYDNRLTSAGDTDYLYDASGARVGRIHNSTTNYFVVDHLDALKRPLAETDAAGNVTRFYVWSGTHLLCHVEADGTVRYYHSDELGSTLALTDESGSVTDQFAYMPYGYANHSGSTDTPFQWLGGYGVYYDAEADLHLTLHRAYSSKTKRFLQPDPLGIDGGVNVYAMANINPLFFIDPYGLSGLESSGNWLGNTLDSAWNWVQDQSWIKLRDYSEETENITFRYKDNVLAVDDPSIAVPTIAKDQFNIDGTLISSQLWGFDAVDNAKGIKDEWGNLRDNEINWGRRALAFGMIGVQSLDYITPFNIPNKGDDIYAGVQEASDFLKNAGVERQYRKQILESFDVRTIQVRQAGDDLFGLRYYDDLDADAAGRYLFNTFPATRQSLAVPPKWNKFQYIQQWQVRPGTTYIEGLAAPQGLHYPGGDLQMYFLNPAVDYLKR